MTRRHVWLIGGVVVLIVAGSVVSTIYEHLSSSAVGRLPPDEQPAGGWIHAFTIASQGSEHQKL